MAKVKFDGVVEVAHYQPNGQLAWVRAYLRRGPAFTDRVKLDRLTLIEHLKSGKLYMAGKRLPYLGGTFEVTNPLKVVQHDSREVLVTGNLQSDRDCLEGVPVI